MLPEWPIVGFTGHRELNKPDEIVPKIGVVLDRLISICGPLVTISSAASGADTLFLGEVARRKLPHLIVLPFDTERFVKDFTAAGWQHVWPHIKNALQVEEISGAASSDEAYLEAGEHTIEQADIVIAVWDGKPAVGLGGTGDAVAHARMLEKPLIWIHSDTGGLVEERLERLPMKAGPVVWNNNQRESVEQHFLELDEIATRHGPRVRHLIQRIILLHLFAAAVGLSVPVFGLQKLPEYVISTSELIVLSAAFILTYAHRRGHEEWMRTRIEAEICRSFLAVWQLRRRTGETKTISVQGFEKLCKNLYLIQCMDVSPLPSLEEARSNYLENRVKNQINYFRQESNNAHRFHHWLKTSALSCTAIATLLTASVLALSILNVEGPVFTASKFLSLILPLVSAALFSIILTQEYARRAARYGEMVAVLEAAAKRLSIVQTWNGLTRIAIETEEQLIQEVIEWHSFTRFAGSPH